MLTRNLSRGVSLIELTIGLAIMAILVGLGFPAFTGFLQNQQIRNAAETTLAGITLARAEAVRRNQNVRYQFVTSLTDSCALPTTLLTTTTSSLNWVVSLADPTGHCSVAPANPGDAGSPTTSDPKIVQKKSAREGSPNAVLQTTGGSTLVFNGLGRVVGTGITRMDFSSSFGTCEHAGGTMRCLSIIVTSGGAAKLCDPKVAITDTRYCG